jgi:hypothetical protein
MFSGHPFCDLPISRGLIGMYGYLVILITSLPSPNVISTLSNHSLFVVCIFTYWKLNWNLLPMGVTCAFLSHICFMMVSCNFRQGLALSCAPAVHPPLYHFIIPCLLQQLFCCVWILFICTEFSGDRCFSTKYLKPDASALILFLINILFLVYCVPWITVVSDYDLSIPIVGLYEWVLRKIFFNGSSSPLSVLASYSVS